MISSRLASPKGMEALAFDDEEETRVENEFCDDKGDRMRG